MTLRNRVHFNNLSELHSKMKNELVAVFEHAIATSDFVMGPAVQEFEEKFADLHGSHEPAVAVGSGTDALILTLRALGIGPGDSVIVPAFTFVATAEAVVNVGAKPIFVDVDPRTLLIDYDSVEDAIEPSVKCIIPVHLYGHLVPRSYIKEWSSRMIVIEDAAQAHLASWGKSQLGSESHAATFSFYPGKNLGALGDGGAVISKDREVLERIRKLRDHGGLEKYRHDLVGTTSRLDSIQAAFLSLKLAHLPKWNVQRNEIAAYYLSCLEGTERIRVVPWSQGSVHHLFVVLVSDDLRSEVVRHLSNADIDFGIHYPYALTQLPPFRRAEVSCPIAERSASQVLSLPMHPLLARHDIERVCETVIGAVRSKTL